MSLEVYRDLASRLLWYMESDPVDTADSGEIQHSRAIDCKSRKEVIGEGLREFAVLVIVFVPLDSFSSGDLRLFAIASAFAVLMGISAFVFGMQLERQRLSTGRT